MLITEAHTRGGYARHSSSTKIVLFDLRSTAHVQLTHDCLLTCYPRPMAATLSPASAIASTSARLSRSSRWTTRTRMTEISARGLYTDSSSKPRALSHRLKMRCEFSLSLHPAQFAPALVTIASRDVGQTGFSNIVLIRCFTNLGKRKIFQRFHPLATSLRVPPPHSVSRKSAPAVRRSNTTAHWTA